MLFSLRFQPKQQTALAAVFAILLLGFEEPCFFEVTDSAADGGGRILEVGGYGRDGRPALVVFVRPVGKIDIHRHGSVRQLGAVKKSRRLIALHPRFS